MVNHGELAAVALGVFSTVKLKSARIIIIICFIFNLASCNSSVSGPIPQKCPGQGVNQQQWCIFHTQNKKHTTEVKSNQSSWF